MPATKRRFGGKVFAPWVVGVSKRDATREAREIRAEGRLARVTKAGDGYTIWVR